MSDVMDHGDRKTVELVLYESEYVNNKDFSEFEKDAIHVKGSNVTVKDCSFYHSTLKGAHGDAIQLIPSSSNKITNRQYGLAYQENTTISGCIVKAPDTDLQGIFSSDGLHYNLTLKNNIIQTKHHGITINGALKVKCQNNIADIKFYPARVGGGGKNGKVIWIIGFHEDYINYEPIVSDSKFLDNRQNVFNDKDIFLTNFRYEDFMIAANEIPSGSGNEVASAFYDLALNYGDIIMGENIIYAQPIENQPKNKKRKDLLSVIKKELHNQEIAGANHNPDIVKYWSSTWYKATNDDEAWCYLTNDIHADIMSHTHCAIGMYT